MNIQTKKLSDLKPAAYNPRVITKRALAGLTASLDRFGNVQPIVWNKRSGNVVGGHQRLKVLQAQGIDEVEVVVVDLDEIDERALNISLNHAGISGEFNHEVDAIIAALQTELPDGIFDSLNLDDFHIPGEPIDGLTDPDDVPDAPEDPITQPGDLWLLGEHRLLCGDCRSLSDADSLIDSPISIAITSPPYASQRKYDESSGFNPIRPDDYVAWFADVAQNIATHLADDGSFFVNIKPCADGLDTSLYVHDLVAAFVRSWGWHFATEFCWERTGVPKRVTGRFKNQFEPIYQFVKGGWKMRAESVRHPSTDVPMSLGKGSGNTGRAGKQGAGGVIPSNRRPRRKGKTSTKSLPQMQGTGANVGEVVGIGWAFPGNRLPTFSGSHEALGHAAAFPVGLPAFFIMAYSDERDTIFDPFMGSGSTLIAAEQLNRKCYGMEISPKYCDIIVKRWEEFTGKTAERKGAE